MHQIKLSPQTARRIAKIAPKKIQLLLLDHAKKPQSSIILESENDLKLISGLICKYRPRAEKLLENASDRTDYLRQIGAINNDEWIGGNEYNQPRGYGAKRVKQMEFLEKYGGQQRLQLNPKKAKKKAKSK
jgi:hypothetical protein